MDTRAARLIVFAGICIPSVHAGSMPIESSSAQSEPRPGLLTQDRLTAAGASRTEFLMTHGNYAQTRFHRADRINRETVKNLKLAWSFEMDVTESIQTAPIVYDGVMYVTSSFNHLFALDAKTGAGGVPLLRAEQSRGRGARRLGLHGHAG
jgi:alcohol dehydrogenase (cytochrome c)